MDLGCLYSKNARGQPIMWHIKINNDQLELEYGLVEGKRITDTIPVKAKRNKSLAQSASELAKSRYNKKLVEGYVPFGEKVRDTKTSVMLADKYEPNKKLIYPVHVEPKLDGMRAIALISNDEVLFMSREGRELTELDHFIPDITTIIRSIEKDLSIDDIRLDGELYIHGLNFEKLVSCVKRSGHSDKESLQYHIFDIIGTNLAFKERQALLSKYVLFYELIKTLPYQLANNSEELEEIMNKYIKDGYEGCMIRDLSGKYEGKRSKGLLKYKRWHDIDGEVVDVIEGQGRERGKAIFRVKLENGEILDVRPADNFEQREMWLKNKDELIGKMYKIKYQELTAKGVPRFPSGIGFCDYQKGDR